MKIKGVPTEVLDNVDETIKKYSLFNTNDICVAYSGGKDSFFLCMVLKELGYSVLPVMIDIGYNSNWDLALHNIRQIGLKCELIGHEQISCMMPEIKTKLEENLVSIEQIKNGTFKRATICTPCHNSKMLILQKWAEKNNICNIANGHHAIDAIASLLKSFYMYMDRWTCGHEEFVYDHFRELILSNKKYYLMERPEFERTSLCKEIESQIEEQHIGTDEPVKQYLGDNRIHLCRPLFHVFEHEIINFFDEQSIQFDESECFRSLYREKGKLTPRELVQYELLGQAPQSLLLYLLEFTKKNLDEQGFLKFNVRNHRAEILGINYKNEKINDIKI